MTGSALLLVPGNGVIQRCNGRVDAVSLPLAFAVLLRDLVQLAAQFSQVIGAGFKCAFLGQQVAAALLVGSPIKRRERGKLKQPLQRLLTFLLVFLRLFDLLYAGFNRFKRLLL